MSKSPQAFRTIREVAEWLDVAAHVLRFWESKFPQIKPVKRAGGRRYYRPGDMELVGGIKVLLHDQGLTIKGVQNILQSEGTSHVASLSPPLDGLDVEAEEEDDLAAWDRELNAPGRAEVEDAEVLAEPAEAAPVLDFTSEEAAEPEPEEAPAEAPEVSQPEPEAPAAAAAGPEPDVPPEPWYPEPGAAADAEPDPEAASEPAFPDATPAPAMPALLAETGTLAARLADLPPEAKASLAPALSRLAALAARMGSARI